MKSKYRGKEAEDMDLSLQIQQKQILSQRMQQSVEILQMNTLALSEWSVTI